MEVDLTEGRRCYNYSASNHDGSQRALGMVWASTILEASCKVLIMNPNSAKLEIEENADRGRS